MRHRRIVAYLEEHDLDAFVVTQADNIYYVSGFLLDVAPWERPAACVVTRGGGAFMVLDELSTHHIRMARERGSLAVADVVHYTEHPRSSHRTASVLDWTKLVRLGLARYGVRPRRLAADALEPTLSPLREGLAEADWHLAGHLLRDMRLVKSARELDLMRAAAALSDWGQDRYAESVRADMLVSDLDQEVTRLVLAEAARRHGGEKVEVRVSTLAGPAAASPHGTGAECGMRIRRGDVLVDILIVRFNGYVVENERTWFVGPPDDRQAHAYATAVEANAAAVAAMRTGAPTCAPDEAAQAVIEAAGLGDHIMHRTGHGVGISGHEAPADMAFNYEPLRAGQVFSAEPGIYIYGLGGFRHDDTVVVGDVPEVLTHRSKRLEDQIVG
ncbi:MAG: Xaa-Pro peptidase family protein [Firmicutes bacterium]|nr:Xaa-Pro peptidase family protein [Bacillota bacterium]